VLCAALATISGLLTLPLAVALMAWLARRSMAVAGKSAKPAPPAPETAWRD
jgi:hypothetical protein